MNSILARTVAALVLLAAPSELRAHQGHGPEFNVAGLLHWFLDPAHLAGVVLVAAVCALTVAAVRRSGTADSS